MKKTYTAFTFVLLAMIPLLLVGSMGCSGIHTVKRDPWILDLGKSVAISSSETDKVLLRISKNGATWEWRAKKEEVVETLLAAYLVVRAKVLVLEKKLSQANGALGGKTKAYNVRVRELEALKVASREQEANMAVCLDVAENLRGVLEASTDDESD